MYESGDAVYICKTGTIFVQSFERQRRVCSKSDDREAEKGNWCGVRSGRDVDKWKEMHLTAGKASKLDHAPIIEECPVNIECKVTEIKELGSHHMFLAKVEAVQVGEEYLDKKGRLQLGKAGLLAYSHGEYLTLGKTLGTFGWSVRKLSASGRKATSRKRKK
jgi:flavin reductase (DIM6/NTAB) family NADH-FMN oxidoreductase RutF